MLIIKYISLVIVAFIGMEGVAWLSHKYIMHGIGWKWHKDHHQHHKGFFEKNDLYAVFFSLIAIGLIFTGIFGNKTLLFLGIGVTLYGVGYFLFHDIVVHRRIKTNFKPQGKYFKRIINAHYMHHKTHKKEGAEAFGFLFALKKFEPKERK